MTDIFKETLKAKSIVSKLLIENPGFSLWVSVAAQLDFILQDFSRDGVWLNSAPKSRVAELILGVQAVREIEPGYPELADMLCNIDYAYKMQYGLQI